MFTQFYIYIELNVTGQSLVQPVLQVTYDDIHQTQMSRRYLIEQFSLTRVKSFFVVSNYATHTPDF